MKITETLIRELIRESLKRDLLTEARFALKNLLIFKETIIDSAGTNLFDAVNQSFIKNGGTQHDLNNPKSAGRFFIDVLFECMEEFHAILADNHGAVDIPDWIMTLTNYILFLFNQKEVTSRSVLSGENFKDYILNFMINYDKIRFPGATTIYEKLQYVYRRLNEKSVINSVEVILNNKETIKSEKETLYPFGERPVNGYLVVMPKTTQSSIFWARTNWLGEEIVLPNQDDISWCTARFKGGNMFTSYFHGGGTTLFYFLPVNDVAGTGKFCIGILKTKNILPEFEHEMNEYQDKMGDESNSKDQDDYRVYEYEHSQKFPEKWYYTLTVGGHTTVDFKNVPILKGEQNDLKDEITRDAINSKLRINNPAVLNGLIKEMETKDFADPEKYVALLDVEQFAAVTNIDNLAPIDTVTGQRDREGLEDMSRQIKTVLNVYNSKLYRVKGYVPDEKILNYVDKNYLYWIKEGIRDLSFIIPKDFRVSEEGISKFINLLITIISENTNPRKKIIADLPDKIFKLTADYLNKIGSNMSLDLVEDLMILTVLIDPTVSVYPKIPDFILKYFNFSTVSGIINYLNTFEKAFSKHNITNDSSFYKEFIKSKCFGPVKKMLLQNKTELSSMSNSALLDLFFQTKVPVFFQFIDKEYFINNEKLILNIAEFAKNQVYVGAKALLLGYGTAFWIFCRNDEKFIMPIKETFPVELLENEQLLIKLIQIDPANYSLIETYNLSSLKNDVEILKLKFANVGWSFIDKHVNPMIEEKFAKGEIITSQFLNTLMEVNPLSLLCICSAMEFNTYDENFKNMLTWLVDFLRDDNNIIKTIMSQKSDRFDYSEEIKKTCIPYGYHFSKIISELYTPLKSIQIIEKKNGKKKNKNYDQTLFDELKIENDRLKNDFELGKYILDLIKKQYIENQRPDDPAFNSQLEKFFKDDCESLIYNLKKSVALQLAELMGKNIINDSVWQFIAENKNSNNFLKPKLILTESQLRNLIARSLRS